MRARRAPCSPATDRSPRRAGAAAPRASALCVGRARRGRPTQLVSATLGLDRSVLPVQGPPGTGKTYPRRAHDRRRAAAGQRVAHHRARATPRSRTSCDDVETCAHEQGDTLRRHLQGRRATRARTAWSTQVDDNDGRPTRRLPARRRHRLAVRARAAPRAVRPALHRRGRAVLARQRGRRRASRRERRAARRPAAAAAGQPGRSTPTAPAPRCSSTSSTARARSCRRAAACCSTETWRMHPDVCAFVSERSYDSRLHSRAACAQPAHRRPPGALTGVGLRTIAVEHDGRSQAQPGGGRRDRRRLPRRCSRARPSPTTRARRAPLEADDILVVAPYNLAVRCIRERVPAGVRVGTVDRSRASRRPSSSTR